MKQALIAFLLATFVAAIAPAESQPSFRFLGFGGPSLRHLLTVAELEI